MTQELEIGATNHVGPAFDEADNRVAQRRCLPWIRGDARLAVKRYGDCAVARAVRTAIGRLHHETQAAALLHGDPRVWRHWPALPSAPETNKGFDPPERLVVKRDHGRKPTVRFGVGKKDELRADRAVMDGVTSFRTVTVRAEASERRGRHG